MPHGHCFLWSPSIVWPHVLADSLITLSYYSIPVALIYFVRKRKDLAFSWIFVMFGAFIFLCGTTHAFDIWTIWHGTYRLQVVILLLTGLVSLSTALLLWKLMPQLLALPSHSQLEDLNHS